jgi:LysR family transcriptional activator of nhaA
MFGALVFVGSEGNRDHRVQLNYNHLYYFHVAAIEGSVAAAASRLGVTQPTVSEQLRSLERTLGSDLFERSQAGLKLTESGRTTLELTSRMFRLAERLVQLFGHRPAEPSRQLRVGVSNGIARSTTCDFLHPLIALEDCMLAIRTGDTVELLRELRGGMLELVLCESEPPEATRRGLESALIDRTELVAVAAPSITPGPGWHDVRFLHYRPSSPFRLEVDAFLDANDLQPRIVVEADDAHVLLELAACGDHVAVVPRPMARHALAAGRLRILAKVEPSTAAVHALYQDNLASGLARRAVAALIQHVEAHGNPDDAT